MGSIPSLSYDQNVDALQIILSHSGYAPGTVDGLRGPQTNRAISNYMKFKGIAGDPATQDAGQLVQRAGQEFINEMSGQAFVVQGC